MQPKEPADFLEEFSGEHAEPAELAELLSELSLGSVRAILPAELERGRVRLLAAVGRGAERFAPLFGKLTQFFDLSPDALRAIFERAERASEWHSGPLPWVSLFHLDGGPAVASLDTGLVRLKKGMPFPRHRHGGSERVLVLEGGYHDHEQRYYGPGDFHDMASGTEHALEMSPDQDVLLAVIMTGEIAVVAP